VQQIVTSGAAVPAASTSANEREGEAKRLSPDE